MLIDLKDIVKTLKPFLESADYKKMAVVHYASGFGNQFASTLNEISEGQNKGKIVEEVYQNLGTTEWPSYILRLKQQDVDLVFADMLQDDFIRFVNDSKRLGFRPKFVTHNDIRNALARKDINMSILDDVIVLNWDVLGSEKFIESFKKKYEVNPINYASQAYVATYILAEALSQNGKDNLNAHLEKNSFNTSEGEYKFNDKHAVTYTPVEVQVIRNGKLET